MRHTKIIATVGPASDSDERLDALIAAGADVVRLNFSHGTHASHSEVYARVRRAAARAKRDVAILQDLSGPKIRTGNLEGGRALHLSRGDKLEIATGDFVGGPGRVSTAFGGLAQGVAPGDRLLLSDGAIELRVESTNGVQILTTVVDGGSLGEHKGINAPGIRLTASAITPKDEEDLRFGLSLGVDLVGVSFVQRAADLDRARTLIAAEGRAGVPIVAKLERPQALEHLDEILDACDLVMIARGDLGLEMPLEQVPRAQKHITIGARQRQVPVILATQVLESMTTEARPTRAEVSDAANAVDDQVDAIMLAGETAIGAFPDRAVRTLDAIIRDAETGSTAYAPVTFVPDPTTAHEQAICDAAVTLADHGNCHAIVAITKGGKTARRLSARRPRMPIFATTGREEIARRMATLWGVLPVCAEISGDFEAAGLFVTRQLVARGLVPKGSAVVLVSIDTDLARTESNYLKIQRV